MRCACLVGHPSPWGVLSRASLAVLGPLPGEDFFSNDTRPEPLITQSAAGDISNPPEVRLVDNAGYRTLCVPTRRVGGARLGRGGRGGGAGDRGGEVPPVPRH